MDSLGIERAALVGISIRGGAALPFALCSPERVEKLVLSASYGLGKDVPHGRLGYFLIHAPLAADLVYALLRRSRRSLRWGLRRTPRSPGGERRARRGSSPSLVPAYVRSGVPLFPQKRGGMVRAEHRSLGPLERTSCANPPGPRRARPSGASRMGAKSTRAPSGLGVARSARLWSLAVARVPERVQPSGRRILVPLNVRSFPAVGDGLV